MQYSFMGNAKEQKISQTGSAFAAYKHCPYTLMLLNCNVQSNVPVFEHRKTYSFRKLDILLLNIKLFDQQKIYGFKALFVLPKRMV